MRRKWYERFQIFDKIGILNKMEFELRNGTLAYCWGNVNLLQPHLVMVYYTVLQLAKAYSIISNGGIVSLHL